VIEIECLPAAKLTVGATVTPLHQIDDNSFNCFFGDVPEEFAFFMEEEFTTFDCIDLFQGHTCDFRLVSHVGGRQGAPWAVFSQYNLDIKRGQTQSQHTPHFSLYAQDFEFALPDNVNFGYFQLICIAADASFAGKEFNYRDLLTFYVYRNRKMRRAVPHPAVIAIRPYAIQTYVPMVPGQHLQLIAQQDSEIEVCDECLYSVGASKVFTVAGEKLQCVTYENRKLSDKVESIFVYGHKLMGIMIPPLKKRGKEVFASFRKPLDEAVVYSEGLDGIEIEDLSQVEWVWDDKCMDMEKTKDGIRIRLTKPLESVFIQRDGEQWWICENAQVLTGRL
jgi:hypothetical protein